MLTLKGRKIDDFGNVILDADGAFEALYAGGDIDGAIVEECPDVALFKKYAVFLDQTVRLAEAPQYEMTREDFDRKNTSQWMIPEPYDSLDVHEYMMGKCRTPSEAQRVAEEMKIYHEYGLVDVLRLMIWLIDVMREEKIVWGIGRGSSVASYVLYLIGVHKVNSIKYGLDFREFLK